MQNTLITTETSLSPTSPEVLAILGETQLSMMREPQAAIQTDHVFHAGMYSRTITMPPFTKLIGALIKIPTLVITVGDGAVYVDGQWKAVRGYQVIPGCAGRKQAFFSVGPLLITMIFPTQAKTVEDAEREFTEEYELLLSRRQDFSTVTMGEI